MPDPFVHLHVASGYSLQYGAAHPHTLVQRAAEQEMDALALTDRDGAYGAIRFAKACMAAGIRPILGVDMGVDPGVAVSGAERPRRRPPGEFHDRGSPVRGGAYRLEALHRVTLLASGRAGWAALCRLISAAHAAADRSNRARPVLDEELITEFVAGREVRVLLGPASSFGDAVTTRRDDLALARLRHWQDLVGPGQLVVEVVSHRLPTRGGAGPGSSAHAARMLGLARSRHLPVVLSNAVRHADRLDAPTIDVLDSARRLVPLDPRHLDRVNAEGFLKSGKQMHDVAEEITHHAGLDGRAGTDLLAATRKLADQCVLDPREDLGIGTVHFPEFDSGSERGPSRQLDGRRSVSGDTSSPARTADPELRRRCEAAIGWRYGNAPRQRIWKRLDDELQCIGQLGYATYFLTVGEVTDIIRDLGIRCAARGSGAGSLVNYLLGISGVDPIRHGLLMERFLSPLRESLPDIDIDVESARRLEVYDAILGRFGADRCATVSMRDTYKVRHAIRDVGAALGMPPGEIDAIAKAFPHVRARDARMALRDLPELRATGLMQADPAFNEMFFKLVESLDGLPRHIAMHPCGVLLSDRTLLDRTPIEASALGYPMSQFDKDDVEDLGLLKLDVLGIRMQSAMAHAVHEIRRVDGIDLDLDDREQVPFDDPTTYRLISSAKTLGIFQIESPGQRELVGKSGIDDFADIITDISLFRPGPVKSDMITPYLEAKQGWRMPRYLHEDLRPILEQTHGVVVYHEQVIEMIAQFTGCSLAQGDEWRRALGDIDGIERARTWFFPRALGRGYSLHVVERVWEVIAAFASFGFCKAHAAAFALPTFQSAWLKAHHPAAFIAGLLTHDPGMYPKRLILDDARQLGIEIRGLDVNTSEATYRVEVTEDGRHAIRLALQELRGISEVEVERIIAGRNDGSATGCYQSLTDFWHRAHVSRPVTERLVLTGAFDGIYGIGASQTRRRGQVSRRDLLLQIGDLDAQRRSADRVHARRARGLSASRRATDRGTAPSSVQLSLELADHAGESAHLPEMTDSDRVRAELELLGLDASRHVIDFHQQLLDALGVVRSRDLLSQRSRSDILVAGVKVATQTPPVRSGRRVIFLTLDDATGPVDAAFFDDVQGPYAATVFKSWLLVVRGVVGRTGRRGVSLRATGAWDLGSLQDLWRSRGLEAVHDEINQVPKGSGDTGQRRVLVHGNGFQMSPYADIKPAGTSPGVVTSEVSRALWHRSPGSAG